MKKILTWPHSILIAFLFSLLLAATNVQASDLGGYQVQPGDVLEISVWKEPDLQREVLVRPDGGISFPLVGDLNVKGQSVADVTAAVTGKLDRFIPDPVVTVSVREMTGNRVYVLGRVNRPGEFTAMRPVSIMQALSMAGGLTPYADEKGILVLRGAGEDQQSIPFNYKQVQEGEALEQNILLQAGDVVMVP